MSYNIIMHTFIFRHILSPEGNEQVIRSVWTLLSNDVVAPVFSDML